MYYYITNLQGDVMSIVDGTGAVVASYEYDPYGNIISATGELAETNPLRYRGYVYDQDTGLYYLQSRYYDPQTGRFINADSVVSGVGSNVLGGNMYTYCLNNPVNMADTTGCWPKWIEDAAEWVSDNIVQPVVNFGHDIEEDVRNYDKDNEDEDIVFSANYFSCYKGVLVIKTPFDASFSFKIIGLSRSQQDAETLKHEYGHTVQFDNMGMGKYIKDVMIPSLTINLLSRQNKLPYDYYSYPWEAEANKLGGATLSQRDKPPLPEGGYTSYWELIQLFWE